jgi:predicted nucleotidyltransferase
VLAFEGNAILQIVASGGLDGLASRVAAQLVASPEVAAVVLTGSHVSGQVGDDSDLDFFVFSDSELEAERNRLAASFADTRFAVVVGDTTFGDSDTWRATGTDTWFDITFWSRAWAEEQLDRVLISRQATLGYSTAFWRSIRNGKPLYERDEWHPNLQRRARSPYPDALTDAIVSKNMTWLASHPFSFRHQIASAVARGDRLSVNHRLAAWFASYFDVLFALNQVLHPGEKRLIDVAEAECSLLPPTLRAEVETALAAVDPLPILDRLLSDLQASIPQVAPVAR